MTLADMIFVDSLKKSGVEYDYTSRKIYPLFQDLKLDLSNKETYIDNVKKAIRANYVYCLRGDDSEYRKILQENKVSDENLVKFEEKFMPFFVEDFRWTEHNYDNMLKKSEELRRWWGSIGDIKQLDSLGLRSIDDFLSSLGKVNDLTQEQFADLVFDKVFEERIKPVLTVKAELLPEKVIF